MVNQRGRLRPVGGKPTPQNLRNIIRADFLAARRHLSYPPLDPVKKYALVHLELDDAIELEAPLGQQAIERFRLRQRSRKTVEHKAAFRVGLTDAIGDNRNHDLVRHQLAALHDAFGLQAHRRAGRDRGAQHVSGRELDYSVFGYQALRLRALTRPRRAEQDQSHRVRPRSLERLISPSYW